MSKFSLNNPFVTQSQVCAYYAVKYLRLLCLGFVIYLPFAPQLLIGQETPATAEQPASEIVLQLKWFHQFNFAGFYAALEKGYYAEVGLDVDIREGQPGMNFVEEVVSGRANYGVEMPELLIARNQGKPVVALAVIFQHSPQIMLSIAESGINSPHNLIGKRVMWRFDSAAELRAMLTREKVSLDQVRFMELSWDINDLIEGRVDAIHAYITDQPFQLEKAGVKGRILQPINYGIDFYGDCLFTSERELLEHPDRVKAFREASLRGWAYAMKHPDELIAIIHDRYNSSYTEEFMRHEYEHLRELMLPKLVQIGHMNPGRWQAIGDIFVKLGMLEPDYTLDGFLYDPNPQFDNRRILRIVWVLGFILLGLSLVAIGLIIFNRRLNRKVQKRTLHLSDEITERKNAESLLIETNARHSAMIENIGDVIAIIGEDGLNKYQSPNVEKWFGWKPDELLGSGWEFIHPDDIERIQGEFKHLLAHENPTTVEYRFRCKDGHYKWIQITAVNRFSDPAINGVLVNYHDISERKRTEKNLEKALLEAQKAIGVKDQFMANISHEIRTPLNSIIGFSDLLQKRLKDAVPEKEQDLFGYITKSGSRLMRTVDSILNISQLQAGMLSVQPVHIDLTAIVNDISYELKPLADEKSLEISVVSPKEPRFVFGDDYCIRQAVSNLVDNAIKYTSKGSVKITLGSRKDHSTLEISDTGIGISKDYQKRIFDAYTQESEGFTKSFQGIGLGLSLTRRYLDLNNIKIELESEKGVGTTFTLIFPKDEEQDDS